MSSADHTRRPDLRLLMSTTLDRLQAVALRYRETPGHDRQALRALYQLRAQISAALYGPAGAAEPAEPAHPGEPTAPPELSRYRFTTHLDRDLVHLTDPDSPTDRERTLCRKTVGFVHRRRPDGKLCRGCCAAFTEQVFPAAQTADAT